jgi:hypothetical protein
MLSCEFRGAARLARRTPFGLFHQTLVWSRRFGDGETLRIIAPADRSRKISG